MNKKTIIKVILDVIMLFMVLLLYNKNVISLTYHEVSGLIIFFAFLIHIGLNAKWVKNMIKFFTKGTNIRAKILFAVDFLLLISFLIVGISGIFISKKVFNLGMENFMSVSWKVVHIKFAAITLIIFGIHLGLHADWIKGVGNRIIKMPKKVSKILLVLFSCVFVLYGVYSVKATSFSRYITLSQTSQSSGNGLGDEQNGSRFSESDAVTNATSNVNSDNEGLQKGTHGIHGGNGSGNGHGQESVSSANIFNIIISYFSITYLFAFITAIIDKLVRNLKNKKVFV